MISRRNWDSGHLCLYKRTDCEIWGLERLRDRVEEGLNLGLGRSINTLNVLTSGIAGANGTDA
jgi:hypothetical protein